ncbi:MAG TPA: hypothetical protein VND22_01305 [Actinomycetota bacterium]|nr:hypothetical protein [Actinomycetota bacterium]
MALALIASLPACAAAVGPKSALEIGARVPSDQGIVTQGDFRRIELDGERSLPVSEDVESFTTRGHEVVPPGRWKSRYVHVGIKDKQVVWVAVIGVVPQGDAPVVIYSGVFDRLDSKKRAVFEDGTVIKLADGVSAPPKGKETVVFIDPAKHVATAVTVQQ